MSFDNGTLEGTAFSTLNTTSTSAEGSIGGKAEAVTSGNRLSGFEFTTDKELVIINKGLTGEKTLTVTSGKASIAVADLAAGEYTVTYEDIPVVEGVFSAELKIKLGREYGKAHSESNPLVLEIKDTITDVVIDEIVLEGEGTEIDEDGYITANLDLDLAQEAAATQRITFTLKKSGYAPYRWDISTEIFNEDAALFVDTVADTFILGHGDIKGSYEDELGDGIIDIDDFIRVVRGFDDEASDEYSAIVDLDEDGAVTVKDLAIVKKNFGYGYGSVK